MGRSVSDSADGRRDLRHGEGGTDMKFTKIAMWSSAAFVAAAAFSAFDGGAAVANSAARPIRGTAHGGLTGFTEAGQLVLDYTGTASHLGSYTRREVLAIDGGNVSGTIA